jgi:D-3-phosphoglycerate dehydrogenase
MIRIGSALFNADHTKLGEELRRTEAAGVDFFHLDVFDGYFVRDQAFPVRTVKALRNLTSRPFEIHLAVNEPERFLPGLREAGANLVFLPAESTPLLYETIYSVRELGMKAGLALALGTSLSVLNSSLPMLDAVLLLGRVTGEGNRGRNFNRLVLERTREVRRMIDEQRLDVDLQAAGGLETADCVEAVCAGVASLPLGGALHRESDMAAYIAMLRDGIELERRQPALSHATNKRLAASDNSSGTRLDSVRRENISVLIASRSFGKNCPEVLEQLENAGCVFMPGFERVPTEEQLMERISSVEVLVSGTEPVTDRVLANAPRLRLIAKHGVGVDNIDLAAAKKRGIPVATAGPAMVDSVADLTLGLLLACARKIPQGDANVKAGGWDRFVGPELRSKTLGIIGLGQIGKAVARRAKGFGLELLAYDALPDAQFAASWGVRYVGFDELLAHSDFISIHAPLLPETRSLFTSSSFEKVKRGAFLLNMARGELLDEEALYQTLRNGRLAGAATDVFATEPPGASPLLSLPNFIAMPHCGGQTPEALRRMGEITGENVLRVVRGENPNYQIM